MPLLTEFNAQSVLKYNYNDKQKAISQMKKSVQLYWKHRNNHKITKSRLKSAIAVIKQLQIMKTAT